jgi:hypothetical protein
LRPTIPNTYTSLFGGKRKLNIRETFGELRVDGWFTLKLTVKEFGVVELKEMQLVPYIAQYLVKS